MYDLEVTSFEQAASWSKRMEPWLLPRLIGVLAVIVIAFWIGSPLAQVICACLAVYALRGARESLEALSLLSFMLLIGGGDLSILRWVVLFAAFGRTLWDGVLMDAPWPRFLGPLLIFFATILVFSLLSSQLPVVSAFKLISFTIGVGTVFTAFRRTWHLRDYWLAWFFTLSVFIVLASAPLAGMSLGYTRGAGFQGILSHPQTFGPVCAVIASFLTGLCLFHHNRSKLVIFSAVVAWAGLFGSQSRTALLAAVLGLFVATGVGIFKTQTWQVQIRRVATSLGTMAAVVIGIVFAVIFWSDVQGAVVKFLLKDDAQGSVAASLEDSRGELIQRSMDNFYTAPITGIGLGIPSDASYARVQTGAFGMPVGASVEKGFMPSAVLEETGVVGAILVLLMLVALVRPVIRSAPLPIFWMLLTSILINFGEMVFFSVGGMGFHFWIIMAFCHTYAIASLPEREAYQPVAQ